MQKLSSDFTSKKIRCDGDLLLPDNADKPAVVIMGGNHFEPYQGDLFDQFVEKQVAFLGKHL